jgi:diguanylate cyclase (GGDEF)-like protein
MSIFSSQVATALQNAKLMLEVKRLAITDEGTNIFNRRHFFHLAEQEFSRSGRYNHPLAAMIIDVDVFKRFNDRYGHIVGDQVLYAVAQTLKQNLREIDILGRYGGEEFSVLLPVIELAAAQRVAERLQTRVADTKVDTDAGPLSVTISVGLATRNQKTQTLLSLIDLADQAMYIAKNAGGNRVAIK